MTRLLHNLLLVFSILLGAFPAAEAQTKAKAYDQMLAGLYKNSVPTLTPSELAHKLKENPASVLLLDTRTPAEFKVSHIGQATFLDYDKARNQDLQRLPKNKTVVVYCSVGYRSERIGERLKKLGFPHVYNLYGGIFQWVNMGLPVVNAQGTTNKVHAYSRTWGIWLQKGEKVYE